jgi:hypothetical protein
MVLGFLGLGGKGLVKQYLLRPETRQACFKNPSPSPLVPENFWLERIEGLGTLFFVTLD